LAKTDAMKAAKLVLTAPPRLRSGEEAKINFHLDQPAMISAFIADDHMRKVIHQFKPAGDNAISFAPADDWGDTIGIRIEATSNPENGGMESAGQIILPLLHKTQQATTAPTAVPTTTAPETAPVLALNGTLPSPLNVGDSITAALTFGNNETPAGSYHYNLSSTPGLKIDSGTTGVINLATGQKKNITLILNVLQPGTQQLTADITGPHNFHISHIWPVAAMSDNLMLASGLQQTLEPKKSWSSTAGEKTPSKHGAGFIIVAPQPFYDFPQILAAALQTHAFTTEDLASKLDILRLWHDVILQSNLLPEQELLARQHGLMMRLLARQKPDGSFPSLPGGNSDIAATSVALTVLGSIDQPPVKLPVEQAAGWLRHNIENSWFDESARPARAAIYAALAATNHLDISSLHYFSDTSADKNLPPLAALQVSLAFAKNSNPDQAGFWLAAAHVGKNSSDISPALLPLLAEDTVFDQHDVLPTLEKLSVDIAKNPARNLETSAAFLRALWHVQNRAGLWRVTINNSEQTLRNILVVDAPEKSALTLYNPSDRPLYFAEAHGTETTPGNTTDITRHIYHLDGREVPASDSLMRSEIYLVVVEGSAAADQGMLFLQDNPAPALRALGCTLDVPFAANAALDWIKNLNLSSAVTCEKAERGLNMYLTPKNGETNWRIAYLAKPENLGLFNVKSASLRTSSSDTEMRQKHKDQLQVQ
jgi:hypothetical protein